MFSRLRMFPLLYCPKKVLYPRCSSLSRWFQPQNQHASRNLRFADPMPAYFDHVAVSPIFVRNQGLAYDSSLLLKLTTFRKFSPCNFPSPIRCLHFSHGKWHSNLSGPLLIVIKLTLQVSTHLISSLLFQHLVGALSFFPRNNFSSMGPVWFPNPPSRDPSQI